MLAAEGNSRPALVRGTEEQARAQGGVKAKDAGADPVLVWGGDEPFSAASMRSPAGRGIGILPPAPRTCWPRTSESRSTSSRGAGRAPWPAVSLDVGRINGERFAVMAGTGLDAS